MFLHKTDGGKKSLLGFILFTGISFFSAAQIVRMPLTAMCSRVQAYSFVQNDVFSFQGNQASLAAIEKFSAGIYSERRFMLKELGQCNAAIAVPTSSGNFGLAAGYAGSMLYNESEIGLAYGRKMGKVNLGVQFNYFQVKVQGYGSAPSVNFEAGAIFKVNERLNTGFHIYNPTGSRLGKNDAERLPIICSMGFGYDASDKFFVGIQVEKVEDHAVGFNACINYVFAENLFSRAGISTATSSFYFGAGYSMNLFRVDVVMHLHQQLGLSPGLMLIYNLKEK